MYIEQHSFDPGGHKIDAFEMNLVCVLSTIFTFQWQSGHNAILVFGTT